MVHDTGPRVRGAAAGRSGSRATTRPCTTAAGSSSAARCGFSSVSRRPMALSSTTTQVQSGVITREECRELVGNHFGKEW